VLNDLSTQSGMLKSACSSIGSSTSRYRQKTVLLCRPQCVKNHLEETSILLFGKSHLEEADENHDRGPWAMYVTVTEMNLECL
jgi:hypothetical protein